MPNIYIQSCHLSNILHGSNSFYENFYPIKACESRQNQFHDKRFGIFSVFGLFWVYLVIFGFICVYLGLFGYIFGYIWLYSRTSSYVPSKILPQLKHLFTREICDKWQLCRVKIIKRDESQNGTLFKKFLRNSTNFLCFLLLQPIP